MRYTLSTSMFIFFSMLMLNCQNDSKRLEGRGDNNPAIDQETTPTADGDASAEREQGEASSGSGNSSGDATRSAVINCEIKACQWIEKANLNEDRSKQSSVALSDGRILTSGGQSGTRMRNSIEIFDPEQNKWTKVGELSHYNYGHASVLLKNSGKVLIIGGYGSKSGLDNEDFLSAVDLFDPTSNSITSVTSMKQKRAMFSAVKLSDGRVLVSGGKIDGRQGENDSTASAEIFDPTNNTWHDAAKMNNKRHLHTSVLLNNGDVIVIGGLAGGAPIRSVEKYSSSSNSWTKLADLPKAKHSHGAVLINDKILVAGGANNDHRYDQHTFLYDIGSNKWSTISDSVNHHSDTLIKVNENYVLSPSLAQNYDSNSSQYARETRLFNMSTMNWEAGPFTNEEFKEPSLVMSSRGVVVMFGGLSPFLSDSNFSDSVSTEILE